MNHLQWCESDINSKPGSVLSDNLMLIMCKDFLYNIHDNIMLLSLIFMPELPRKKS